MVRPGSFLLFLLAFVNAPYSTAAPEDPPYSPAVDAARMAIYTNVDLGFSIRYPVDFKAETPQTLFAVMRAGHQAAFGGDPATDPEHGQAEKCMRPLLYATSTTAVLAEGKDPVPAAGSGASGSPDSVLVMDVDRSCFAKNLKGDKALTQLTGSVLHLPNVTQLVPQMWFQGGEHRHIHSGMSGGMITIPSSTGNSTPATASQVPFYMAASAFEQKDHWVLVAYLNGTRADIHKAFGFTSVSFDGDRQVLLFPYLLGKYNLVK